MPDPSRQDRNHSPDPALELCEQSRQPRLAGLDDAALMALIAELSAERDRRAASDPDDGPDAGSVADRLRLALNRAHAERRKRKLRRDGSARATPAAAPARPAAPEHPPASRRKAAGRKAADSRKTDLRTAAHRVKPTRKAAKAPELAAPPAPAPAPRRLDRVATDQPARPAESETENQPGKAGGKAGKKAEKRVAKAAKDTGKAKKKDKKDKKDKKKSAAGKKGRKT